MRGRSDATTRRSTCGRRRPTGLASPAVAKGLPRRRLRCSRGRLTVDRSGDCAAPTWCAIVGEAPPFNERDKRGVESAGLIAEHPLRLMRRRVQVAIDSPAASDRLLIDPCWCRASRTSQVVLLKPGCVGERNGRLRLHLVPAQYVGTTSCSGSAVRPRRHSTTTRPSRSSALIASTSRSATGRGCAATSRNAVERRWRNEPSNGDCLRVGSSLVPTDGHVARAGTAAPRESRARQHRRPKIHQRLRGGAGEAISGASLDALHVDVARQHVLAERKVPYRGGRVRADAGERRQIGRPAVPRHQDGCPVERSSATPVVAETLPFADHLGRRGRGKRARRSASARARPRSAGTTRSTCVCCSMTSLTRMA